MGFCHVVVEENVDDYRTHGGYADVETARKTMERKAKSIAKVDDAEMKKVGPNKIVVHSLHGCFHQPGTTIVVKKIWF